METWNNHRIRPYHNQIMVSGRPWMLYNAPETKNAQDYGVPVEVDDLEICLEDVQPKEKVACCELIHDLCIIIIEEHNLPIPETPDDMYELYIFLRTVINQQMQEID